jgi:hypothetical protein
MFQNHQNATGHRRSGSSVEAPHPETDDAFRGFPAPHGVIARLIRGESRKEFGRMTPVAAIPGPDTSPTREAKAPSSDPSFVRRSRISPRPTDADTGKATGNGAIRPRSATWLRVPCPHAPRRPRYPWPGDPAFRRGGGFAICVVLPLALLIFYMTAFARPQFTSTVAFTVRSMEHGSASDALSGFAQFAGGTAARMP